MKPRTGLSIAAILILFLFAGFVQATCDPGWVISYYPNQQWSGTPTVTDTSEYIHFADPTAVNSYSWATSDIPNWPYGIIGRLQDYSLTADGYVNIATAGQYTFSTVSDDGVELWVDGTKLVTNTGDHAPTTNSGAITLSAGYHHVVLNYRENLFGSDPTTSGPGNVAVIFLQYTDAAGTVPSFVPGCHMTTPSPEFPSALVPATFIIGLLGAVFLVRRMK